MSSQTQSIIMIVLMLAIMYFMLIRPQQKKDKEVRAMREALKPGDEIVTIGGIIGKVVRIKDDIVTIEVGSDKTKMDIAKWGISGMVNEVKVPAQQKKEAAPAEESGKASPKKIKKLGQKEEAVEEAAPVVSETVEAVEADIEK